MAYDHELADRVRVLIDDEFIVEKEMFGGLAFLVGGNMSVAASGQGGLLVRVDPTVTDELLAEPGAEEFEMGGRGPLKGWLRVNPEALSDRTTLEAWVSRGVTYARSLPPCQITAATSCGIPDNGQRHASDQNAFSRSASR